jgi:hypothetical protein
MRKGMKEGPRNQMPKIEGVGPSLKFLFDVNRLYVGPGSADKKPRLYLLGLIRLVDKALLEYRRARAARSRYCRNPDKWLDVSVDHLENCINAIARANKTSTNGMSLTNGACATTQ